MGDTAGLSSRTKMKPLLRFSVSKNVGGFRQESGEHFSECGFSRRRLGGRDADELYGSVDANETGAESDEH